MVVASRFFSPADPLIGYTSAAAVQKPLPDDLSFDALFAPKPEYEYFARAAAHPFRPTASSFDLCNAWWLADAALLAYVREEVRVRGALERAGLTDVVLVERDATYCFVARAADFAIVSFRGTDVGESRHLEADAKFWHAAWEGGARVHAGFKKALDRVWDELAGLLTGPGPVWFTGHSLGAALATLASDRHGRGQGLYTFGSPRVGNRKFRDRFATPAYRFVNNNDAVTELPPAGAYAHVGALKFLDHDGRLLQEAGTFRRTVSSAVGHLTRIREVVPRWLAGDLKALGLDQLVDHSPLHYAIRVWNAFAQNR